MVLAVTIIGVDHDLVNIVTSFFCNKDRMYKSFIWSHKIHHVEWKDINSVTILNPVECQFTDISNSKLSFSPSTHHP